MLILLQSNWEHILEKWGWPTLVLVSLVIVISILGRVVIWPIFKKKLEQGDRAIEKVEELLVTQVEKADARVEKADRMTESLLKDFKDAIEHGSRESKRQADLLEELLRRTPRQQ